MTKYADDIRRIAKGPGVKPGIDGIDNRDPIPGTNVEFVDAVLATTSTGGGGPEDPDKDTDNDGTDPNDMNDGSNGGDPTDLEELLDGDTKDDHLTGLDGITDCTTSQPINISFTDEFLTVPPGWDGPELPPLDPTISTVPICADFACPPTTLGAFTSLWSSSDGRRHQLGWSAEFVPPSSNENRGHWWDGAWTFVGLCTHCGSFEGNFPFHWKSDVVYTETQRGGSDEIQWPTDGAYDLALIDGIFKPSEFDSEAPANAGGGILDVCFGSGRTGRIGVTRDGGFYIGETVSDGGALTGTARVYNKTGNLVNSGDGSTNFLQQYLPQ